MRTLLIAIVGLLVLVFGATPASAEVICTSPELPPGCGEYRTPADVHAAFANPDPAIIEAILHDVSHSRFLNVVRTPIGPDELEDFDSTVEALVDIELSVGGWLYDIPVSLSGPVSVLTYNKVGNTTGTFQTEILAMSLSGNMAGMPVTVQEDPGLITLGQTTITDLGGGLYQIDSFFDVFTEVSVNGGAFVPQTAGPSRVDLVEPPTCGDGLIEGTEACDDGGVATGDGCNASCQIESDWSCSGEPSVCEECGDGDLGGLPELYGELAAGYAKDLEVVGTLLYLADRSDGMRVIDISDPSDPTQIGIIDADDQVEDLDISGSYAYLADADAGLRIIDISTPSSPSETGIFDTPGQARDVKVSGNYAYVADRYSGLRIIDISTPASPSETGSYDTPDYARDVEIVGSLAYVADGSTGVVVIDVSTPASPSLHATFSAGYARDVEVIGDVAYVAGNQDGLFIFDITDTENPDELSNLDTPYFAWDVEIDGDTVYVADQSTGVLVIDATDLENPSLTLTIDTADAEDVKIDGDYAYVADGNSPPATDAALRVFDLTAGSGPIDECDDGDTTPGDGCDASCQIETGWICAGEPSVCSEDCGDGIVVGSEECDDGNDEDEDYCTNDCLLPEPTQTLLYASALVTLALLRRRTA